MHNQNKKVLVALSGGVDSAVAAALLKKQGLVVTGVYFRFFDGARSLESQVKKIAKKLEIPFKIVDARNVFKKRVIDYFLSSYKKSLTPNPCVVCNKEMKFRLLFDLMKKEKADFVATGHYARVIRETKNQKPKTKNKENLIYKLCEAVDKLKDQSYFLYRLSQKELFKIIFPLGDYKKSDVKNMAKKMKLPVAENESQDVCFLGRNDLNTYLNKYLKTSQGEIVDESGKILGQHRGLHFYTLGQRKGIKVGGPSGQGPFFVLRKDARKNELVVTNNPKDLLAKEFLISAANWIDPKTKFPLRAGVQIRYHAQIFPAIIKKEAGGNYAVAVGKPLRAVTSGQSAVFYKNGEVLGGGTII